METRILVTARSFRNTPGQHTELLRQSGHRIVESPFDRPLCEEEMLRLIPEVSAVILGLDKMTDKVIAAARCLKVISRYGAGVDDVDQKRSHWEEPRGETSDVGL